MQLNEQKVFVFFLTSKKKFIGGNTLKLFDNTFNFRITIPPNSIHKLQSKYRSKEHVFQYGFETDNYPVDKNRVVSQTEKSCIA